MFILVKTKLTCNNFLAKSVFSIVSRKVISKLLHYDLRTCPYQVLSQSFNQIGKLLFTPICFFSLYPFELKWQWARIYTQQIRIKNYNDYHFPVPFEWNETINCLYQTSLAILIYVRELLLSLYYGSVHLGSKHENKIEHNFQKQNYYVSMVFVTNFVNSL